MPEFATRQDLAQAAHNVGLRQLVADGVPVDEMPEGDTELHAAWRALMDAYEDLEDAIRWVRGLLPPPETGEDLG